jgi:hypothetical protein
MSDSPTLLVKMSMTLSSADSALRFVARTGNDFHAHIPDS